MKRIIAILALSAAVISTAAAAPLDQPAAPATYTKAQAEAGRTEYVANCVDCHGQNLNDGEFGGPPLIGDAFREKWFGKPVGNLIGFVSGAMPPDAPGRLPLGTYAEIVAYILSANGVAASDHELPADKAALGVPALGVQKPAAPPLP